MYLSKLGIATLPQDLVMLVEMGLPPMAVIKATTIRAAECIGCQEELGTIENGKLADLIVVDDDPLKDIKALQKVSVVIKNGYVEKNTLNT